MEETLQCSYSIQCSRYMQLQISLRGNNFRPCSLKTHTGPLRLGLDNEQLAQVGVSHVSPPPRPCSVTAAWARARSAWRSCRCARAASTNDDAFDVDMVCVGGERRCLDRPVNGRKSFHTISSNEVSLTGTFGLFIFRVT